MDYSILEPSDQQKKIQRDYIRVVLLRHDIYGFNKAYGEAAKKNDIIECFRILKATFVPYSILLDSIKMLSIYTRDNDELSKMRKKLIPLLEFMNHLRNKMSGHLDDEVLNKVIQWEPSMFVKEIVEQEKLHTFLIYKTLLESAINTRVAENIKVFKGEIDVCYPPDWEMFIAFMDETYSTSVRYLDLLIMTIKPKLSLVKHEESLLKAIWAGATDFNLKK